MEPEPEGVDPREKIVLYYNKQSTTQENVVAQFPPLLTRAPAKEWFFNETQIFWKTQNYQYSGMEFLSHANITNVCYMLDVSILPTN